MRPASKTGAEAAGRLLPGTPCDAVLAKLPAAARVAIVRLRSLGDVLLTTPALAALQAWRPDLRLAYVVEERWQPAVAGNPALETVISVAGGAAGRIRGLRQLRRFHPQLVVDLHGGTTAAWLTRLSGARWRAGFAGHRHGWARNLHVPPAQPPEGQKRLHTAQQTASLFYYLGLPSGDLGPQHLTLPPEALETARARLRAQGLQGRYAFVHAVPRSTTMQWPAERYVDLLAWLRRRHGLGAVLARAARSRPGEPTAEARIVAGLEPGSAALVTGTSVSDLLGLIAGAELVVGSDGGPIHAGAALGKAVAVLFSSTDAEVWSPWQARYRMIRNPWPCQPCRDDHCYAFAQPECVLSIKREQVQAAITELLQ